MLTRIFTYPLKFQGLDFQIPYEEMVDEGSFCNFGNLNCVAFPLIGKMLQTKSLQYDENHGAF